MYPILLYLRIDVCVLVINNNSCVSCPVLSDFLLFVLSGKRPALLAFLYLVPSRKRRVATHVCRFALCICMLNRSLNLSSRCICIPLAPSCKFSCRTHFLRIINVVYGVFAGKASPSQHYNHTSELSRSPGSASL